MNQESKDCIIAMIEGKKVIIPSLPKREGAYCIFEDGKFYLVDKHGRYFELYSFIIGSISDIDYSGWHEYEPPTDWTKVEVDTRVWVKFQGNREWYARHFAEYNDGKIYCFDDGKTSHTKGVSGLSRWDIATLKDPNK